MSKADNPQGFKSQHIEVTERGVAAARAALAEAHKKALEAEEAHRLNMAQVLEAERAKIQALRVELYGQAATEALEAEETLEGNAT